MKETSDINPEGAPKTKEERVYDTVRNLYEFVMSSDEGGKTIKWTGYTAGIGFRVEGLGFNEPSLQKLLSVLHQKEKSPDFLNLAAKSVTALRAFDYTKEVLPEYQEDFINSGSLEIIKKVADELENSLR